MKVILLAILAVTLLIACTGDGKNPDGMYAGITVSDLPMDRLNACEEALQSLVDELSGKASALARSKISPRISIRQVHSRFTATAVVDENIITINPQLCETAITPQTRYVIAHELGHFVARARLLSNGTSFEYVGNHQISIAGESDADRFAKQILDVDQ